MMKENQYENSEEAQSFLGRKQHSSSSLSSSPKRRSKKRQGSEVSSRVSTKDLNSSFDDITTYEGGYNDHDHDHTPVHHESLFAQSIFSNTKSHEDPFELDQISNQPYFFYDSYPSSDNEKEDKEEDQFHFINFPKRFNDNSSFDDALEIIPMNIIEEQEQQQQQQQSLPLQHQLLQQSQSQSIEEDTQMKKKIQFKITKKGRKKKSTKPKKINKAFPPRIQCGHCNCSNIFYTEKQHTRHHNKFSPLCTKDTVNLIKLVAKTKRILLQLSQSQPMVKHSTFDLQKVKDKYANVVRFVPQRDHFNYLSGNQFDDCLTEDDDDYEEGEECTEDKTHNEQQSSSISI